MSDNVQLGNRWVCGGVESVEKQSLTAAFFQLTNKLQVSNITRGYHTASYDRKMNIHLPLM
jgi:hypothetical protein